FTWPRVTQMAIRKAPRSNTTGYCRAIRRFNMPVRSLNSSVLVWPDRAQVDRAARVWAEAVARDRSDVQRIGYFGSYARGDWGVGSDLDLVAVVDAPEEPFEQRSVSWPL